MFTPFDDQAGSFSPTWSESPIPEPAAISERTPPQILQLLRMGSKVIGFGAMMTMGAVDCRMAKLVIDQAHATPNEGIAEGLYYLGMAGVIIGLKGVRNSIQSYRHTRHQDQMKTLDNS